MAAIVLSRVVTAHLAQPLDLEIAGGSFAVFAGRTDAGHSNVLRVIAGLDPLVSGEITIDGGQVHHLKPNERGVAMVFADDSLYPQMTVRKNLEFGLRRTGFAASEVGKRIDEVASALSITDLLDHKSNSLPFVEGQRVALARALVRQPKILLLDHPFAHVDPTSAVALTNEISALHDRLRITTLFATDDPSQAMSLGDMVALFEGGMLRGAGSPRRLYEQPENTFVAQFFGSPPMNLIRGELKQTRTGLRFHEAGSGTIEFGIPNADRFDFAAGAQIIVGIRPHDITVANESQTTDARNAFTFRALAESVLPAGDESEIHFQTGAHSGVCRTANWLERNHSGQRMIFVGNLEKLHFFDAESHQNYIRH